MGNEAKTGYTIYETDSFELYTDKNGKYWLWDKEDESNLAIRAKTEIEAYREAVDMAVFTIGLIKSSRRVLQEKVDTLEVAFREVFESGEE